MGVKARIKSGALVDVAGVERVGDGPGMRIEVLVLTEAHPHPYPFPEDEVELRGSPRELANMLRHLAGYL